MRDRSRLATLHYISYCWQQRVNTFSPSAFFSRSQRRIVSSCNISAVCAEARRPSEPRLPSSRAPSDLFRAFKLTKNYHLDILQVLPVVCSIPLLFALRQLFWQLRTLRSCQVALLFSFFQLDNKFTEGCTDNLNSAYNSKNGESTRYWFDFVTSGSTSNAALSVALADSLIVLFGLLLDSKVRKTTEWQELNLSWPVSSTYSYRQTFETTKTG